MKISIAIADDSKVFRKAFLRTMKSQKEFDFIIEAENGLELLQKIEHQQPNIVLLDINMPVLNGFEAARIIVEKYPGIKIIAFTQYDFEDNVIEMNKIGVKSFLGKDQVDDVAKIISIVNSGGVYLPDKVAIILQTYLGRTSQVQIRPPFELSNSEKVLLQLICKGMSHIEIGTIICKSPRTVEKYRNDLYQKFNVRNQQQLIFVASKWTF